MNPERLLLWVVCLCLLSACEPVPHPLNPTTGKASGEPVILDCQSQCDQVTRLIEDAGGRVRHRFVNLPVISANIPASATIQINRLLGHRAISKDVLIAPPQPVEKLQLEAHSNSKVKTLDLSLLDAIAGGRKLSSYSFNNGVTGAATAHDKGIIGSDIIVAVIDSGSANNPQRVPVLADSIIGGESFVVADNEPSATSTLNDEHGTWTASMIAGHGVLIMPPSAELAQATAAHMPSSIIHLNADNIAIPIIGTAPGAKIYALKTFPANGDGASSSVVLQAMDRALTLKRNFNKGMATDPVSGDGSEDNPFVYDALNIQVVNMSLGGPTLFAGLDIDDRFVEMMLEEGIIVVTSAGNEGFAGMTGASPGTSTASVTVGAASSPMNERVLRDMQKGLGTGIQFRPTNHFQTAFFSSRGPTADGRTGIDLVANGMASLVQGADGHISHVSGTSFSAPTVSGAVALLRGNFPEVSSNDIRIALIESANPTLISNRPSTIDQGHGFLNVPDALKMLGNAPLENHLPTSVKAEPNSRVSDNILQANVTILSFDSQNKITADFDLAPGEVKHLFIETTPDTASINVNIENLQTQLPLPLQNALFGDDLMLTILDAPTSFDHVLLKEVIAQDANFVTEAPQPGIMRVALMGDWTNAGNIRGQLTLSAVHHPLPSVVAQGSIIDEKTDTFTLDVPPDTASLEFTLSWQGDWSVYPTHDIDLILTDPKDNLILGGATLHSPERVLIENPEPGSWTLAIEGFLVHELQDEYELRITDNLGNTLTPNIVPAQPPTP